MAPDDFRPEQVAERFDVTAAAYDAAREKLVPGYADFYRIAVEQLAFPADRSVRILDLGAGTGLLSARVLRSLPEAEVWLVDFSNEMLDRARQRLKNMRAQFVKLDYTQEPLGGPYDAVVSALSIHHLPDSDKQHLFARVRKALAPGGVFVNADQVAGPTPALSAEYHRRWLDAVRAAGATADEMRDAEHRMTEDRCTPLELQMEWMRTAGFANVDCWYKNGRFAVMSGSRAA